ncbi:MAG: hypothetical protein GF375_04340 [Candidatus Omnitrophica bacterium]|nr:hypothetical protein [Candidatus Omnitrophota bacterium]
MFELKQTGERDVATKNGVVKKPIYESVEDAFERYACEAIGVPNEKEEKVVEVLIPSAIKGGKPTKASQRMPCLPSPAHEICTKAEELFNEEQDISYRVGYTEGYRDRDENKKAQTELTLASTELSNGLLVKFSEAAKTLVDPEIHSKLVVTFKEGLQHKRDFGYSNGYWQGYKDKAGGVMPKFQHWEDPNKEGEEYRW